MTAIHCWPLHCGGDGGGDEPEMVDVLGDRDASAMAELLTWSRVTIGARSALCSVQVNGQMGGLVEARPALAAALGLAQYPSKWSAFVSSGPELPAAAAAA